MDGIELLYSANSTLKNNTMVSCGIFIYGTNIAHWNTHFIDKNNSMNSKPIFYLKNINAYLYRFYS